MSDTILELRNISARYGERAHGASRLPQQAGTSGQRLVHDINLTISKGEFVAIVGDPDSGVSTVGRLIAGATIPATGTIQCPGMVGRPTPRQRRDWARAVQSIAEDSLVSPRSKQRVGSVLSEAPVSHGLIANPDHETYVAYLLRSVGLHPAYAQRSLERLSASARLRVSMARAVAMQPSVLVYDDTSPGIDMLNHPYVPDVLTELRGRMKLACVLITHTLAKAARLADRIAIMYLGRIVESGPAEDVLQSPAHPYTQALVFEERESGSLASDRSTGGAIPLGHSGPAAGCDFSPRCPLAGSRCRSERPILHKIASDRSSACHLHDV